MNEFLIFALGFLAGIVFTIFVVARAGYNAVKQDIDKQVYYQQNFKAECDAEGHKWCDDPKCRIKYHCTRCGHTLEQ